MCELLGMNASTPTDVMFSFTGLACRAAEHKDGFGIAFFEDRGLRHFIDPVSAVHSPIAELTATLAELVPRVAAHGTFNFMLSNGQALWAHCSTKLHYLVRQHPFQAAHLQDEDMSVDFARVTTPADRVAVVVTEPLTANEAWVPFAPGEIKVFVDGLPVGP